MIFDFNIPYKKNYSEYDCSKPKRDPVPFKMRAGFAWAHLGDLPSRLVSTIMEIAKMFFYSVCSAFCFGQAKFMNEGVRLSAHSTVFQAKQAAFDAVGFFAPINVAEWKIKASEKYTEAMKKIAEDKKNPNIIFGLHVALATV